jgi:hypothetical protein
MAADYRESFVPRAWRTLDFDQRTRALQDLENDHARRAGREPFTVRPAATCPTAGRWSTPKSGY